MNRNRNRNKNSHVVVIPLTENRLSIEVHIIMNSNIPKLAEWKNMGTWLYLRMKMRPYY